MLDKQFLTTVVAVGVVAGLVAAGTSYLLVAPLASQLGPGPAGGASGDGQATTPSPGQDQAGGDGSPGGPSPTDGDPDASPGGGNTTDPGSGTADGPGGGDGNATDPDGGAGDGAPEVGAVWAFVAQPEPAAGTVAVFLSKVEGDRNRSASDGSLPIQLAAVNWTAFSLVPPENGTILEALNARFAASPPVAMSEGLLSRHGDGVQLSVPVDRNVSSVIVNAPLTGEFVVVDWPSGRPYAWAPERGWLEITEGPARVLAAPPPGA